MKKLIFVRHGRAEDGGPETRDIERSLTDKGKVVTRQMAELFKLKEGDPGILVSSPAFRALETALIFGDVLGVDPESIMVNSDLYHRAGLKNLMEILEEIPDEVDTITLFGHNPAFTELPDRLSKEGSEFMTKTAIVCISFPLKIWQDIKPGAGSIEYFMKPQKAV